MDGCRERQATRDGGTQRSSQAEPALGGLAFLTTSSPIASISVRKQLCHRDDKKPNTIVPADISSDSVKSVRDVTLAEQTPLSEKTWETQRRKTAPLPRAKFSSFNRGGRGLAGTPFLLRRGVPTRDV